MILQRVAFLAILLTVQVAAAAKPRLGGLRGARGNGAQLEEEILAAVNDLRARRKLPPLAMDEKLRSFAREHAELAARGDPKVNQADARIKAEKLAPIAYRLQYAAGTQAQAVLRELTKEKAALAGVLVELGRIGIGAFLVPEEPPYFQVALLAVQDPDPMAGKPGLTREETDKVMNEAAKEIQRDCYDVALKKDPNLRASLVFQIVIGDQGQVDSGKLLSGTGLATFDACALSAVRGLTFPVPYKGKPVTLAHPMRFAPPQGEKVIGKLSSEKVSRTFAIAAADFRECYEVRLKAKPGLKGSLELSLTVAPDGGITTLAASRDELQDEPLAACVLERTRKLRFPEPEFGGAAEVVFPLRFDLPTRPAGD